MKFHYEFEIKKLPVPIQHQQKLFLLGSCFTENIGEKLTRNKFRIFENPNGILFNPVSVAEAILFCIDDKKFNEGDLFYYNEAWHSWKHHSKFSSPQQEEALHKINRSLSKAHNFLKDADFLFITLGSAWIYTFTEKAMNAKKGEVAANNHKAPADWFYRKLMQTEEVLSCLDNVIHRLKLFNQKLKIIFTISPVRHLREGVIENNRSKSVLIQSVHQLVEKFEGIYYFPAYELVIDDLRDYRFYAEDLVHPNYFATQYVWEKLVQAYFSEEAKKIMEELDSIQLAFQHKPFNPGSSHHKKFLNSYYEKCSALAKLHPYIDLEKELTYFKE